MPRATGSGKFLESLAFMQLTMPFLSGLAGLEVTQTTWLQYDTFWMAGHSFRQSTVQNLVRQYLETRMVWTRRRLSFNLENKFLTLRSLFQGWLIPLCTSTMIKNFKGSLSPKFIMKNHKNGCYAVYSKNRLDLRGNTSIMIGLSTKKVASNLTTVSPSLWGCQQQKRQHQAWIYHRSSFSTCPQTPMFASVLQGTPLW